MLKHLITIVGCVLALLCVYVYFISQDLRKLNTDLLKNKTDIQSLIASLSNLYKDQLSCSIKKKKRDPIINKPDDDLDEISSEDIKKIINEIPADDEEEEKVDIELPKELSEEDFDDIVLLEEDFDKTQQDEQHDEEEDLKLIPADKLKSYTLVKLRDYCKKNDLSTKGTKDALISRIVILAA